MKELKIFAHSNPQFGRCPECNEVGTLHRSRARSMKEQVIKKITFFKLFRCKTCGWRGFKSTFSFTQQSVKTIILYASIIIATALIIRFVLTKFIIR
ncbi:hypothetical protein APF79_10670 [bacterium BRH_c32]|nr:MAG: hypothetical protein APF79_10670 [bacterium BRH_c32]